MRARAMAMAFVLAAVSGTATGSGDEGLVAHYSFDKGEGSVVLDNTGNGNDGQMLGGAKWVTGPYGTALEFNGDDGYVDCGTGEGLDIAPEGTIMVWCKPYSAQGGLVCWNTGEGWPDERLILAIRTYESAPTTMGCFADGKTAAGFTGFDQLPLNEWTLLAFTFDGKSVSVYQDGLLNEVTDQNVAPDVSGVPLWIGRCRGLGDEFFHGLIDDVRIYNRPLSAAEVFAQYEDEAKQRDKDVSLFSRVGIKTHVYPDPAKLVVTLDSRGMFPLPQGATLRALLGRSEGRAPLQRRDVREIPPVGTTEAAFDMRECKPGPYTIKVWAAGPNGVRIKGETSVAVEWPGQSERFKNVKVLNNLCWELLNRKPALFGGIRRKNIFTVPIHRWVYIRTTANVPEGGAVWAAVDSAERDEAVSVHVEHGESTLEATRYLAAGEHTLYIGREGGARMTHIVVRAIPVLQYAFAYTDKPIIEPYGPYDWEFLGKDVLPNVNTLLTGRTPGDDDIEWWMKRGGHWLSLINVPREKAEGEKAVEEVYKHWTGAIGMKHPATDGIIIDEFGGGDDPVYEIYRKAVERIYNNPEFEGKGVTPYGGTFYGLNRSTEFARTCVEGGGYIAWEQYLSEARTQEEAQRLIRRSITQEMPLWEEGLPGCTERMIVVLGYLSQPNESLNVNPSVNFKVFMEMQFREIATDPAFFGLGGIQEYAAGYCDEENVRWAGRLYRHYGIEGSRGPLTDDPYALSHLANPDFARGTDGWTVWPAERGKAERRTHAGYSWLQGRYPRTSMGDSFLVMKRSQKGPNTFDREIKHLKPGRLYSLKMITGDYGNLVNEESVEKVHAVSITLRDVEILPGPKKSFQWPFHSNYAHDLGKFNRDHPYWMNYHWRVFRAKRSTARFKVSDWKDEETPGGPIGQEVMFNFIEVQPYIED